MSERTEVTNKIMSHIQTHSGFWGVKIFGCGNQGKGLPDIICCYKGNFIGIECKKPQGGRIEKLQAHELMKITKSGGVGIIAKSLDDFLKIIERIDNSDV